MMLLKFSVTHFTEVTEDLSRILVKRLTVRKCDGICWCQVGRRDISLAV
jgi:hypothetical protein